MCRANEKRSAAPNCLQSTKITEANVRRLIADTLCVLVATLLCDANTLKPVRARVRVWMFYKGEI